MMVPTSLADFDKPHAGFGEAAGHRGDAGTDLYFPDKSIHNTAFSMITTKPRL